MVLVKFSIMVWLMLGKLIILDSIQLQEKMFSLFTKSKTIFIISPFINFSKFFDYYTGESIKIATNFTKKIFERSSSDIDFFVKANEKNAEIKHIEKLHSKIYLFDDCIIIGSSNFTYGGLKNNIETNVLISKEDESFESIPVFDDEIEIEELGNAIRQFIGVKLPFKNKSAYNQKAFNYYRSVLESKGILVSQISGVSLEEMKGISIYYDEYPIIAVNNKDYERAKTFSLMHELAHLIRRSSSLCMIDFNERNDEEEKLCDRIAAEILMPKEIFVNLSKLEINHSGEWDDESLRSVADRFGVSIFAVIRRLFETGLIDKSFYISLYDEMSDIFRENQAEIDANNEGRQLIIPYYAKYLNKEGYLFTKTVMNSYSRGRISYGEMCHTLGVSSEHINKMERAVMFV